MARVPVWPGGGVPVWPGSGVWVAWQWCLGVPTGLTTAVLLEVTAASGLMFEAGVNPSAIKEFRTFIST